jgi:transposase
VFCHGISRPVRR